VFGMPIGTDRTGDIYQHETSYDAAGTAIDSYLETGFFEIGDSTTLAEVDWIIPDMKWNVGATSPGIVNFTFYVSDYPGDTEKQYGPYAVTNTTQYVNTRFRGRFCRMRVESSDAGTFWRLGRVSFRWNPVGRR
jgi:hypothetical protein